RFAPLDVDIGVLQETMGSIGAGIIGRRMFDHLGDETIELERTRVVESPYATHLTYTVRR
ncbi:MAG: hypothetical protein ACRDOL_39390, partial [Streptosporangiaceae bacterium]